MATAKEVIVKEENLCCSICLELYDNPRTLPCLHSFCHLCLVGYAKKTVDGKEELDCPVCRAETKLDLKLINNVEEWVESLPINFTLVSILDNKKMNTSDVRGYCEQCLRENVEALATVYCYECSEQLCDNCTEVHKKVKILSSHKLCNIKNSQENVAKLELLKSITRCPEHQSEEVRYICIDHDQLCCNECAIVTHRKCNKMVSVAKETDKTESSLQETSIRLKELSEYLKVLTAHEKNHQFIMATYENEMIDNLKVIKKRIDEAYLAMEQAVIGDFQKKSGSILKESALRKQEIETLETEVKQSSTKMETAKELGQPVHLFLVERILRNEIKRHTERIHDVHKRLSKRIIRAVENTLVNKIEENLALCLHNEMENRRVNIPECPGLFKYKSFLEVVKSTDNTSHKHCDENTTEQFPDVSVEGEDEKYVKGDDNESVTDEEEHKHFVLVSQKKKHKRKKSK